MDFEQSILDELNTNAKDLFEFCLIDRLDFDEADVYKAVKNVSISQIEVCWNQKKPFDAFHYLTDKLNFFEELGLKNMAFHSETPLLVTKYHSDILPGAVRMAHKIYVKTKFILRNELILGIELKTLVPFINGTLSDLFFSNSHMAKMFVYSKFILQHLRRTVGLEYEKYRHGYLRFVQTKRGDQQWKKKYLEGLLKDSGIPIEFMNIDFFDSFSDLIETVGFVQRRNFSHLSYKQYRRLVSESPNFVRMGYGKYRLKEHSVLFNANLEYRTIRANLDLIYPEESRLNHIYQSDAGLNVGSSKLQTS